MDEKTMCDMSSSAMTDTDGITAEAIESIDRMIKSASSHAINRTFGPAQSGEISADALEVRVGDESESGNLLRGSVNYDGEYVSVRRVVGQNG